MKARKIFYWASLILHIIGYAMVLHFYDWKFASMATALQLVTVVTIKTIVMIFPEYLKDKR